MDDKTRRKIRRIANKGLTLGGQAATVGLHLSTTTTALGKIAAAAGVAQVLFGRSESLTERYAEAEKISLSSGLSRCIFNLLGSKLEGGEELNKEREWFLRGSGGKLVWVKSEDQTPHGPWIVSMTESEARVMLATALWTELGPRALLSVRSWGESVALTPLPPRPSYRSALATKLTSQIKLYIAAGHNRSLMLHGPPGTGKTSILMGIAAGVRGFVLQYQARGWGGDILRETGVLLAPTSLIIDDICRGSTGDLLQSIEDLGTTTPFIGCSANYLEAIDPALQRPGRFDRTELVLYLDADALHAMVGDYEILADDRQELEALPAAYVNEFCVTSEVEGVDAAVKLIPRLCERAAAIASAAPVVKPAPPQP